MEEKRSFSGEDIVKAFTILKYSSNDPIYKEAFMVVMSYVNELQDIIKEYKDKENSNN